MAFNVIYLGCGAVATAVLIYKFRDLPTWWGSPRVRAMCGMVFFGAVTLWLAAPTPMRWVNRTTGVPNIGELLADGSLTAFAASCLALALFWRYPARTAWARVRWILAAYTVVILIMIVLFSLSSVPEEHVFGDFALFYATQPTAAAFSMSWLTALLIATATLTYWCFTWARHQDYTDLPWLRRGLRLYGAGSLSLTIHPLWQIVVVSANWFGIHALNFLYTTVVALAALLGTLFITTALLVPLWGPCWLAVHTWVSRWRIFLILRPLHHTLSHVNPDVIFVASGKRLNPHHRVRRIVIELSDWHWALAPVFDPAVRQAAQRLGQEAGLTGQELNATVEAVQLKAASHAWRHGVRTAADTPGEQDDAQDRGGQDGMDIGTEFSWWVQVARAFKASPVVADALGEVHTARARTSGSRS